PGAAHVRALPSSVRGELSLHRGAGSDRCDARAAGGRAGMTAQRGDAAPRLQHDRQHAIYLLALREGSVDVADLARRYGVTTETIRRDLSDMQGRQLLRRVHGGAVPVE